MTEAYRQVHGRNKQLLLRMLAGLASAGDEVEEVLSTCCSSDAVFDVFHPVNRLKGLAAVADGLWKPLRVALPDHEHRVNLVLGGSYGGHDWVSSLGHVMGAFDRPWLGIPATHGLVFLRFGINAVVEEGRITHAYVLFDAIDVMRQAGYYPLRRMPGSPEQWPAPPAVVEDADPDPVATAARVLRVVREMQAGLDTDEHSPHWHPGMNWYGPAGIGSTRGRRGFDDFHGTPFVRGFPDWYDPPRRPGHYLQIADGRLAVTGGWPSLVLTHTGGGWMGLPPSGRQIEMRVADWYRADADDLLVDNWVAIDVPHILLQAGLDVFDELRFMVDPSLPR